MASSVKSTGWKDRILSEVRKGGRARERAARHMTIGRSLSKAGHMTDWKCTLLLPEVTSVCVCDTMSCLLSLSLTVYSM